MPPLVSPALLQSFEAACDEHGLPPLLVLEIFTGALSIEVSLFSGSGLTYLASQVFKQFMDAVKPKLPVHPEKKERAITNIRQMIKVEWGYGTDEDKSMRNRALMDAWFHLNGLHNVENKLVLSREMSLNLPRYYLLICDLVLTPPLEPVRFFMERVVSSNWKKNKDCPALALVAFAADAIHTAAAENETQPHANN